MKKNALILATIFITLIGFLYQSWAEEKQFQAQQVDGVFKYPSDMIIVPETNKAYISSKETGVINIVDLTLSPPAVTDQIILPSTGEIKLVSLAYNKQYQNLYALDWAGSRVFVMDISTDRLIGTPIIVGGYPQNIVVSSDGQTFFVCANQNDEIIMINSLSRTITEKIYIGEDADPFGMAIANDKLYVAGRFSNKVYIIDIKKQIEIKRIKVTLSPYDLIASQDGLYIYVSHDTAEGEISIIDTVTDQYISSIQIKEAFETNFKNSKGLVIYENNLFVANFGDQSISVINTTLNKKISFCHPLFSGANYPEKLVMSDNGKRLYIVHPVSDNVTMLDLPQEKPAFVKGPDIKIKNCDGEQYIQNWAKDIQVGMNSGFQFVCTTNNESFFSKLPQISSNGTLTLTPSTSAEGKASVNVQLVRNSTMPDMCDTSDLQTFDIQITLCDPILSLNKIGNGEIVIDNDLRVLPPYEQQYSKGRQIQLFGRPYSESWLFSHWKMDNGETAPTNPLEITINADTSICGVFVENIPVQLQINGNCTIVVNEQRYELPWSHLFTPGTYVSIQVPVHFSHWTEDYVGKTNPLSLKMNNEIQLVAHCNTKTSSQYYLKKGFNLVSLSVVPENNTLEKVFPQTKVAYSYENGRYDRASSIEPGKAYWIQMPSTRTLSVTGTQFSNYQIKMKKGWQLIGGIHQIAQIKTIPENCVQIIYGYSDGEYQKCQSIAPTKGYWIYLDQDCELLMDVE